MSIVKVANIAGVSSSTVSRVINGYRNVNASTALAVKKAIKQIGYEPLEPSCRRGPARHLSPGIKTRNIAVAWFEPVSELSATHFVQAINGVSEALIEHGLNPIICNLGNSNSLPPAIIKSNIDGCIIISGEPSGLFTQKTADLPIIWMSSRNSPSGENAIAGSELIGKMAAQYLIDRGHKLIAFFNPYPNHSGIIARGKGFEFAAYKANVEVKNFIGKSPSAYPQTLKELEADLIWPLFKTFLQESPLPKGLFIPEDMATAVVYRLMEQNGIRPQKDIDIISADNETAYLAGLNPRPATIDIGSSINGRHAVDRLMWKLRNPDEHRSVQVVIQPVLVKGEEG